MALVLAVNVMASTASTRPTREAQDGAVASKRIQDALATLAKGGGDWKRFSLTYDDIHGLHGGLMLTIEGTGKVTQNAVRQSVGEAREVSLTELRQLVQLLLTHKAWEQREADRPPIPDESKASIVITYGADSVTVWEWYNDLVRNARLLEIRDAMERAAWKSVPKGD